jgi:uncharacterized membrane protein HdeD (DUF308 family)
MGDERDGPPTPPHERLEVCLQLGTSARWRWHAAEGVALMLLGTASLLTAKAGNPVVSGTILMAVGGVGLLAIWRAEQYPSYVLSQLLALVAIATGLHLLQASADAPLGLIFAAFFALRGVVTILIGAAHRRQLLNQWEWFTVSGVTSLILAGLIMAGLPGPYGWMLGLLLGVDLVFDGSALMALVLSSDRLSASAPAPALDDEAAALRARPAYEDSMHV